jgi:deoxyribodipyrimidine photo-lyase
MSDPLRFAAGDARLRPLNARPPSPRGDFVLYWMQAYRRSEDNAALAFALERARDLGVACLVYEALAADDPHASARLHRFALEGARDTAAGLAWRGVLYALHLASRRDEVRAVLAQLMARARAVVSDDYPGATVVAENGAAAERAPCSYVVVDDCAVVPLALLGPAVTRATLGRALDAWLRPIAEPAPPAVFHSRVDLPFDPVDFSRAAPPALVDGCAVDHGVPAVDETPGGSIEAQRRLRAFVRGPLATYDADRSDPSRAGTSGLSPYLAFGMLSPRRVALEARAWAEGAGLDAFLDRLLVRRAAAFAFARARPDHASYAALPLWARATLEAHARDARAADLLRDDLEAARSPDDLWNASMRELRARGAVQPYARILWGKLPLLWTRHPRDAHAAVVHLNDKWALDGRDPAAYAGVGWCFGLHDRPAGERRVFGAVRAMTSGGARRKLEFEDYLVRWRT